MREIYVVQCAGSRLLLLQCCWCEYWRVMRCYTRPADTLHTHNTNTSCDYYKCVSTVGHSSCNFLIFTNKTVIICPHQARSPANPLTLGRGRYQHQGTRGLGIHYQTTFIALALSSFLPYPFAFQVYTTLNSLLSSLSPCR